MAARIALTFSAFLLALGMAVAGPYQDLDHKLAGAKSDADRLSILRSSQVVQADSELRGMVAPANSDEDSQVSYSPKEIVQMIELRAGAESATTHSGAQQLAAEIKRSPIYEDHGERETTNWLSQAFERLRKFQFNPPRIKSASPDLGWLGTMVIWLAWAILIAAVITFLYFVLKLVDFSKLKIRRRAQPLVDDFEVERTLDEWLEMAAKLEAEGRYREAVRSLYLACLLKLDEARVARFDRGQTNWEHLARIESSPRRPAGLDFRTPTQAFDRIWYGYQLEGAPDVERFRGWYMSIVESTRQVAA